MPLIWSIRESPVFTHETVVKFVDSRFLLVSLEEMTFCFILWWHGSSQFCVHLTLEEMTFWLSHMMRWKFTILCFYWNYYIFFGLTISFTNFKIAHESDSVINISTFTFTFKASGYKLYPHDTYIPDCSDIPSPTLA